MLTSVLLAFVADTYVLPKGWLKRGASPDSYDMGIAVGKGVNGINAGTIKAKDPEEESWATLMQNIKPGKFAGHKVKLSGDVKSSDDVQWGVIWLRVDKPVDMSRLDNMGERGLHGEHDWTKCEVVLSVPKEAENIAFGGMMAGPGQIWFCNLKLEIVPDSEKETTDEQFANNGTRPKNISVNDVPTNLNFKE
jgi:hypothetical protein